MMRLETVKKRCTESTADEIDSFLRGEIDCDCRDLLRRARDALRGFEKVKMDEKLLQNAGLSETELAYLGYRSNNRRQQKA